MRRIPSGALSALRTPTTAPPPTTLRPIDEDGLSRAMADMEQRLANLDRCPWWRVRKKFRLLGEYTAAIDHAIRAELAAIRGVPPPPRDPTIYTV